MSSLPFDIYSLIDSDLPISLNHRRQIEIITENCVLCGQPIREEFIPTDFTYYVCGFQVTKRLFLDIEDRIAKKRF